MDFEHETDDQIETDLLRDVQTEFEVLPRILSRLREVDIRKIYSKHGLSSVESYAMKKLGYTEDEAARRISAMRLLRELPQLETKLEEGKLKLTHLVRARSVFRKEAKANRARTTEQKLSLLERLENTTLSETEKTLEREAFVDISKPKNEVSLEQFDGKIRDDLIRLLDLRGGISKGLTLQELIGQLAELGLEKWDPIRKAERAAERHETRKSKAAATNELSNAMQPALARVNRRNDPAATAYEDRRKQMSAPVRHTVYLRDGGRCATCGSSRNCQVDHIIPAAMGGTNESPTSDCFVAHATYAARSSRTAWVK